MDKSPADVLEEAADIMLLRGVARGTLGQPGGPRCAMGAIVEAGAGMGQVTVDAHMALIAHIRCGVPGWNDNTEDDFVIIDGLRGAAKDLRNGEVA